ncbi:hypothetical protein L6R49_26725 [Myxococcota bacterium]|nr:hypothetical protein [Myxococcota bacterium]
MNQSGNGFAEAVTVRGVPVSLRPEELQVADLYGDGTACLVWMGPVLRPGAVALQQLRLLSTGKPWLLTTSNNGLGREVRLTYTPSTTFYLNDRAAGRPWATRLPFPVHCLSKMESFDSITGWRFVGEYAYHHGFFDGEEREFRGFGMVEQWDTERASDHEDPALADPAIVVQQPPERGPEPVGRSPANQGSGEVRVDAEVAEPHAALGLDLLQGGASVRREGEGRPVLTPGAMAPDDVRVEVAGVAHRLVLQHPRHVHGAALGLDNGHGVEADKERIVDRGRMP